MLVLIDMNLSPQWVRIFAEHGIAAAHWRDLGAPDATDSEIFAWARAHDHIVFTHDLDFSTILARSRASKPSVVQLRHPNAAPDTHGEQVAQIFLRYKPELAQGALISIEPDNQRLRLLPL